MTGRRSFASLRMTLWMALGTRARPQHSVATGTFMNKMDRVLPVQNVTTPKDVGVRCFAISLPVAGAVGAVGNGGGSLPAFSKSCGKARPHRGFSQDGRFHNPV